MKVILLTFALGLLIGASTACADFIISSTRTSNAFTLNTQSYDIIQFTVTDNLQGVTNGFSNQIDLAMYDSTGGGKNGMLISAGTLLGVQGYPDLFAENGEASLPHTSWLNSNIQGNTTTLFRSFAGSSVGMFNGGTFTYDQAASNITFANTYTDQELVGAISADETWGSGQGITVSSPGAMFAQAVVEHGDSVTLVAPTRDGRVFPSTTWDTGGTAFGIDGTPMIIAAQAGFPSPTGTGIGAYTEGEVPEPSSALALAAIALLARRKRHAN